VILTLQINIFISGIVIMQFILRYVTSTVEKIIYGYYKYRWISNVSGYVVFGKS